MASEMRLLRFASASDTTGGGGGGGGDDEGEAAEREERSCGVGSPTFVVVVVVVGFVAGQPRTIVPRGWCAGPLLRRSDTAVLPEVLGDPTTKLPRLLIASRFLDSEKLNDAVPPATRCP
mmetsp:Transcript_1718/g.3902  ORF Transcript_1718/g.3902 Transcript_1718/m.3902 type:complete len:120 (-) Transcript_1718:213-572(-)